MAAARAGPASCPSPHTGVMEEARRGLPAPLSAQASLIHFQNFFLSQSSVTLHPGPGLGSNVIYADKF